MQYVQQTSNPCTLFLSILQGSGGLAELLVFSKPPTQETIQTSVYELLLNV